MNTEAQAVKKESQMIRELKQLSEAIQFLNSLVTDIEERLEPFLRSASLKENNDEPIEMLVPFGELIRREKYAVQNANSRIKDLLDRLEI